MLKSRAAMVVGVLVVLGGFTFALTEVFRLRFAAGDIYPPYSSLRADPLGTRALYDSLASVGDGKQVRRNFRGFSDRAQLERSTLLVLGLEFWELTASSNEFRRIDHFVRDGGRLVITLFPRNERPTALSLLLAGQVATKTNGVWTAPARGILDDAARVGLMQHWGFGVDVKSPPRTGRKFEPVPVQRAGEIPGLPSIITWHSGLVLTNLAADWRTIYERDGLAVMAERSLGRGSVVVATDSYLTSNEALRDDRQTSVLAALLGPGPEWVFDETHLGVEQSSGLASLAREYRMGGALLALLGLALLFVWKSASPLLPRHAGVDHGAITGFDAFSGFRRLLRRAIPTSEIMGLAWTEWQKSTPKPASPERVAAAAELVAGELAQPPKRRDPVRLYRAVVAALSSRDRRRPSRR